MKLPSGKRKFRARHWITSLSLRYAGARISEVLYLDDIRDVNFRRAELIFPTLKRREHQKRTVPVPETLIGEMGRVLAEFPELRGKLFGLSRIWFFQVFQERCQEAGIPSDLAHPHVLRHTRAIELLCNGVLMTVVQDLLGHASISTAAMYLKFSAQEARQILKDRRLI